MLCEFALWLEKMSIVFREGDIFWFMLRNQTDFIKIKKKDKLCIE